MGRELFEGAYRKFWDCIEARVTSRYQRHSYQLCDEVREVYWRIPFSYLMVDGELRESINDLNSWQRALDTLALWSAILADYNEEESWALRHEFVEPVVYFCMHQPSSTRDRLGQVATNGIHQVNLNLVDGYEDALDQDKGKFLSRSRIESQLNRLAGHWTSGHHLLASLRSLDSKEYRQQTYNFRNRASHFIAPRLELGEVEFVTRSVETSEKMVLQADGSYRMEEVPGKTSIAYSFGGISPLTLKEIIEANSREYELAAIALDAYSDLLREVLAAMKERQGKVSK